ncbi:MAG TPA: glycoside hydrolase family 43 protein [Candidatus Limnocylindria bacterium]
MRSRRALSVLLSMVLLAACASPSGDDEEPVTSGSAALSAAPSAGAAEPSGSVAPTPGEGEFMNPVIDANMPDPFVLDTGDQYYLYSTTNITDNYPYAISDDLVTWEQQGDAMPRLPLWANGNPWAPEVTQTSAGYVMYFTARAPSLARPDGAGAQCVGVAVSESPGGPFVDDSDEPLVCQVDLGGTIDASIVRDADGALWLIYKNDGNCCGLPTRFFMRPMSEDGLSFAGDEIEVEGIVNDQPWEGGVVEAPTIHFHDGTYYLFYSANNYAGPDYAVGYATSSSLTGPYQDAEENPILATEGTAIGPGHQTIIADRDGDLWLVYHAWEYTLRERKVWIDELRFEDGRPIIDGPDSTPQEAP